MSLNEKPAMQTKDKRAIRYTNLNLKRSSLLLSWQSKHGDVCVGGRHFGYWNTGKFRKQYWKYTSSN